MLQINQKDLIPFSHIITANLAASFLAPLFTSLHHFSLMMGIIKSYAEQTQKFCISIETILSLEEGKGICKAEKRFISKRNKPT